MQHYIGTKALAARPMTRGNYNEYRGWKAPEGEDQEVEGYLVEYLDGGVPNDDRHKGYISWSPKPQFENAYQPNGSMSFGHAIVALKAGKRVARAGWNGKGMWLSLSGGIEGSYVNGEDFWSDNNAEYAFTLKDRKAHVLPSITMKTADGSILMGWLASQTDMLAEDWCIIDA